MKIVTTRRISQIFFFCLFVWFCVVTTLGDKWWQLRGWPVNWILELDPLVGLATLLSTRTLYAGLLWGLATVVLTILLGRFFCGWVCPFGAIHQFVGFAANRRKPAADKIKRNRYRPAQMLKYWILIFLLTISTFELALDLIRLPVTHRWFFAALILAALATIFIMTLRHQRLNSKKTAFWFAVFTVIWLLLSSAVKDRQTSAAARFGHLSSAFEKP